MANAFRKAANFLGLVDDQDGDLAPAVVEETPRRSMRSSAPSITETPSATHLYE